MRRTPVCAFACLLLTACGAQEAPWETAAARDTVADIAAARAALSKNTPSPGEATHKPATGPSIPLSAVPERMRPGAAQPAKRPPARAPAVPRPVPEPARPAAPKPTQPASKAQPPTQPPKTTKLPRGPKQVDVGDPYGTLTWIDAISLIQAPRAEARLVAARVLGMLGLTQDQVAHTRDMLRAASKDEDERVRKAAQRALKRVAP